MGLSGILDNNYLEGEKMKCNTCKIEMRIDAENAEQYCPKCGLVEDYFEQQTTATQLSNAIGTHKAGRIVRASSLLTWKEKNVAKATWLLEIIESKLMLPNIVVKDALYIYRLLLEKNLIKGRSIEALICACVYIASKRNNHELSFDDFKRYNNVRRLKQAYKCIIKNFNIKLKHKAVDDILLDALHRFNLNEHARVFAVKLLQQLREKNIFQSRNPRVIAGCILYLTSVELGLILNQRIICNALSICPRTLGTNYLKTSEALQK